METLPTKPAPQGGIGKRILWISLALLFAQLIGSAFNIWYNLSHIRPLLAPVQIEKFTAAISWFNGIVYPVALAIWGILMLSIARAYNGIERDGEAWKKATRRMINLPWFALFVSGAAWLLSIPVLLVAVNSTSVPLDSQVGLHLPVSIVIAALISMAQGFFAVEILTQRLLYPLFLSDAKSTGTLGAFRITLKRRGVIWAISSVVCPILSLMLLFIVAVPGDGNNSRAVLFPLSVGAFGIAFGFVSALLIARIIIEPVEALRESARRVANGEFDTRIDLLRTDEFGTLIDQFNTMMTGLREKQQVEDLLGRNVGIEVARHLLEHGENLKGTERSITVMFTDIRGFTPRCAASEPRQVVTMLNIFFDVMVPEVERRRGVVNQFVGDGFLAIFGAIEDANEGHEDDAAAAGCEMISALPRVNGLLAEAGIEPLEIGVGINSGPAVIGSIGASGRTSFTAVGDTVNVSARIESMTKEVGYPLLLSDSTYDALREKPDATRLAPMIIKGKAEAITVYGIEC